MPAHVASDTARDGESARERPSKTYHVQVRTVEDKSEADRAVSAVMTWFDGLDREERPLPLSRVSTVPVDVRWKAPFYRVRVGPFTSKEAAESVLESVQRRFPDAFIAKEVIDDAPASRGTFWYESPAGTVDDWNRDRDWEDERSWRRKREHGWEEWKRDEQRHEEVRRYEQKQPDALEGDRERLERERERRDREWERRRKQWERERDPHQGRSDDRAKTDGAERESDKHDDEQDDGGW
jgi:hypothetical protein